MAEQVQQRRAGWQRAAVTVGVGAVLDAREVVQYEAVRWSAKRRQQERVRNVLNTIEGEAS